MGLAPVMRLVVEEMIERLAQDLLDLGRVGDGRIAEACVERLVVEPVDIGLDAPVLDLSRTAQIVKILVQNGVEPRRRLALAREAAHPEAIAHEKMIERALQGFEEGAAIGAVIRIADGRRRVIEPAVCPGIVKREARIAMLHEVAELEHAGKMRGYRRASAPSSPIGLFYPNDQIFLSRC